MNPSPCRLGFAIEGTVKDKRHVVLHAATFSGYATLAEWVNPAAEAYLSAFAFAPDFRQHVREQGGSTRGYAGRCGASIIWWDIDRRDDLGRALDDARRLVGNILDEFRSLDEADPLVFHSGSKGFHVGLPAVWNPPPSTTFHRAARRFAETIADRASVTIDTSVYDKLRPFRLPNSRHPNTGRFKRRLDIDEFMNLPIDRILELAAEPIAFNLPTPKLSPDDLARLNALWSEAASADEQAREAAAARRSTDGPARLNRSTLEFLRDGANDGERATRLFQAAANCGEFWSVAELAEALLTEAALDCGLTPSEVRKQIADGLRHGGKGAVA
jgi:hypothetical protein